MLSALLRTSVLPGWQFRGCRTAEKRLSCCPPCTMSLAAPGQTGCRSEPGVQQPHSQEERSDACPTGGMDVGSEVLEILAMAGVAHWDIPHVSCWTSILQTGIGSSEQEEINSYNKRHKELLAPLCPPQRQWVTWPKPGRGHGWWHVTETGKVRSW